MTFDFKNKDNIDELPEQIRSYLAQYIQNRMDDFSQIKRIDFDMLFIRDYCHKVIGSARSYNLHQLEEITLVLQKLARADQRDEITELLGDYEIYLNDLAQKYLKN